MKGRDRIAPCGDTEQVLGRVGSLATGTLGGKEGRGCYGADAEHNGGKTFRYHRPIDGDDDNENDDDNMTMVR